VSSVDFLAELGPSADVRAVAQVLSAAAAPPWPHELRGYEAARRAFESAGTAGSAAGAARSGNAPIRHSAGFPLRRLLGVKLAAVAGALTVTGVAVAAEADVLPSPIQRAAHQMLGGVGVPQPDPESRTGQTMASSSGSSALHGESPNSAGSNQASGDHSGGGLLPGTPVGTSDTSGQPTSGAADALALCRAYLAHPGNGNGNGNSGLSDHDRRRLAALAGGEDKIEDFCAQVLATASGTPVPQPSCASSLQTTPSATPDPSHDHKPDTTSTSSSPNFGPQTSDSGTSDGNGHTHTPNPTRSSH
jgi:hypothetical protein